MPGMIEQIPTGYRATALGAFDTLGPTDPRAHGDDCGIELWKAIEGRPGHVEVTMLYVSHHSPDGDIVRRCAFCEANATTL